jgi:DNA-binding transcriptional ArsR family regulator
MTAIAAEQPSLRALTDDELRTAFDTGEITLEALTDECDRRDRAGRSRQARRAGEGEWREGAHAQFLAAEAETNGYLLSRAGQAAGIDPWSLWSGPEATALKYASEELREFWLANPRMTAAEYDRQRRDGARAERDAWSAPEPLSSYSDIELLDPEWLWQGLIPLGEVTVLAAKGGTGKSFAMCDLAARVSRGDSMPDGSAGGPAGSVIWITAEDDPSTVLGWRLTAARARKDRIHDLSDPGGIPFTIGGPDDCLEALREAIAAAGDVRLVVIDPLSAVSAYSLTSVVRVRREVMRPLRDLARDTGVAVVCVHHLTKAGDVAGSRAVVDAVRSVLLVTKGDDGLRTVRVVKSNMARDEAPPVRYRIIGEWPDSAVDWLADDPSGDGSKAGGPAQARILMALANASGPRTGQQVAATTGIAYGTVRVILSKLARRGLVTSPERGLWTVPPREAPINSAGQSAVSR